MIGKKGIIVGVLVSVFVGVFIGGLFFLLLNGGGRGDQNGGHSLRMSENAAEIASVTAGFDFVPSIDEEDIIEREDGLLAVDGEIAIRWVDDVNEATKNQIIEQAGATLLKDIPNIFLSVVTVESTTVDATVEILNPNESVIVATPSYVLESNIEPTESAYKEAENNWWLKTVHAEEAWEISQGSPTSLVGVVDGGFTLDHADLSDAFVDIQANYTNNPGLTGGDHGTHVTGIIGMRMNNAEGLVGIAPQTQMGVAKTWSMLRVADAFRFFANIPSIDVVSVSMGENWWAVNKRRAEKGLPALTLEQKRAVADAIDLVLEPAVLLLAVMNDTLIVHSAGNDSGYASLNTMDFDEVLTVAASNYRDGLASFSNYGLRVDIAAPGVQIYSTVPSGYDYMSGTSMATPLVAGTAALIRAENPSLTYKEVKKILIDTAEPTDGLFSHHFGRLDAWRALLKATNKMAVEGYVFDDETYDVIYSARITSPSAESVLTDKSGYYLIPAMDRERSDLRATAGFKGDDQEVIPPTNDLIAEVDFVLQDETGPTNLNTNSDEEDEPESLFAEYVVWRGVNANVGLNISTRESYEEEVLARNYSGGGIDPEKLLEKELFMSQTFITFEEANEYMCERLTDVRVWPLGAGLHGVWTDGEAYAIGNFNCSK